MYTPPCVHQKQTRKWVGMGFRAANRAGWGRNKSRCGKTGNDVRNDFVNENEVNGEKTREGESGLRY